MGLLGGYSGIASDAEGTGENHLKEWLSLPCFKGTNARAVMAKVNWKWDWGIPRNPARLIINHFKPLELLVFILLLCETVEPGMRSGTMQCGWDLRKFDENISWPRIQIDAHTPHPPSPQCEMFQNFIQGWSFLFSKYWESWQKSYETFMSHPPWKYHNIFLLTEQKIMMKCQIPVGRYWFSSDPAWTWALMGVLELKFKLLVWLSSKPALVWCLSSENLY